MSFKMILHDGQITEHFNIKEFACKANNEILLNDRVIDHIQRLEKFRQWYKRAMYVNSGYRTPEYNKQIGGSSKSQHLLGLACDIALPDEFFTFGKERQNQFLTNVKNQWSVLCNLDGLRGGVGWYNDFFHIDSRVGSGLLVFWDLRTHK